MLRDEVAKYTELSGNDGWHTPIGIIGAYLDGYEKGLESRENIKGEWIPVSERLPKAFETVLRTKVENGWNGTTCTIVDTGCICPSDYNIVAWMPLPEPYKKGGE